jgi:hypothetical protein
MLWRHQAEQGVERGPVGPQDSGAVVRDVEQQTLQRGKVLLVS